VAVALCWVTTPDAAGWGPPLMYHVGEQVTAPTDRDRPRGPQRSSPAVLFKNRFRAVAQIVRLVQQCLQTSWQGHQSVVTVRQNHARLPGRLAGLGRDFVDVFFLARGQRNRQLPIRIPGRRKGVRNS